MQADSVSVFFGPLQVGAVAALWRYPVSPVMARS
jgi:hypothetical protein